MKPTQANFDETYNKVPQSMGPDQVGSWPASASPFGALDMAGNIGEWTVISLTSEQAGSFRGGSYYWGGLTNRTNNRNTVERSSRTSTVGLRVCADL